MSKSAFFGEKTDLVILIILIFIATYFGMGFLSGSSDTYALVMMFWAYTVPSCTILFLVSLFNRSSQVLKLKKLSFIGMGLAIFLIVVNGANAGYHYLDWRLNKPTQEQIDRMNSISFGTLNDARIGRAPAGTEVQKEVYESWYSTQSQCFQENLKGIKPKGDTTILEVFWSTSKNTCLLVTLGIYSDAQDWTYEYEKETGIILPVHIYQITDLSTLSRQNRTLEHEAYSLDNLDEYLNNSDTFADLWRIDFEKTLEQYR